MKKTTIRLLLAVLLIGVVIGVLASCNFPGGKTAEFTVKVMDGETLVKEYTFEDGEALVIPTADIAKAGYTAAGLYTDAELTAALAADATATADMTLYVKYTAKSYYLYVDNGLGDEEQITVTYGETYTLTAPEKDGYRFLNYSYKKAEFPLTGAYTYTDDITVVAKWSKIVYLNVFDGTGFTKVEVAADGSYALPDVADIGDNEFLGYMNGTEAFGTYDAASGKWIGTYTGTEDLTLTYAWQVPPAETLLDPAEGVLPAGAANPVVLADSGKLPVPTREGFVFLGWKNGTVLFSDAKGNYTYDGSAAIPLLVAAWRNNEALGEVAGKNYFKEIDASTGEIVYVFLTGVNNSYLFTGYTIALSNVTNNAVTLNGDQNGFVANATGSFKMTLTAADGSTRTVSCKVETRVNSFTSNKATDAAYAQNFKNGISSVLNAGIADLIPDIAVRGYRNNKDTKLSLSDIPYVLTVEVWNGTAYEATDATYSMEHGAIYFDAAMVGKQVKITFAPKYALAADTQAVSFEYLLNNGVNVYTNDELYDAFNNNATTVINVMRNIEAALQHEHTAAGHDVNCTCGLGDLSAYGNVPVNQYEHGVYYRLQKSADEQLTIHGNYYKIDGSKLPAVDARNPASAYKTDDGKWLGKVGYKMVNVQVGIFSYYGSDAYAASPTLSIDNLYLHGSYNGNSTEISSSMAGSANTDEVLKGSMAFHGIITRYVNLNLDNSNVQYNNISLFNSGFSSYSGSDNATGLRAVVNVTDTIIDNYMAQSVYIWGQVGLTLRGTTIGQGSGISIAVDEGPISDPNDSGYIKIDSATTIKNFITGNEAWFNSLGMNYYAGQAKVGLDQAVGSASGDALTVIKKDANNNEFFNAILCVRQNKSSYWGAYSDTYEYVYYPVYSIAADDTETLLNPLSTGLSGVGPCGQEQMMFYATMKGQLPFQLSMMLEAMPKSN